MAGKNTTLKPAFTCYCELALKSAGKKPPARKKQYFRVARWRCEGAACLLPVWCDGGDWLRDLVVLCRQIADRKYRAQRGSRSPLRTYVLNIIYHIALHHYGSGSCQVAKSCHQMALFYRSTHQQ
jgi:hypothetical protein